MPANRNDLIWNATVKAYPAICDLQAPESFVRLTECKLNVGAPSYNHDLYTVPAGKIFKLEFLMVLSWNPDPNSVTFILRSGVTDYGFYSAAYGAAFTQHTWDKPILFDEDEIVRIFWNATLAATKVCGTCFGYLFNKY